MPNKILKSAHNQASASPIQQMGLIIDHLVDALASDPSCPVRRALILNDIDAYPQTTQSAISDRLKIDKHTMSRDIQWLYDNGCIRREDGTSDGRVQHMTVVGYSQKSLALALDYCEKSNKNLQNVLETYIRGFKEHKPTLRDVKLLVTSVELGEASRQELLDRLYQEPPSTKSRALDYLMDEGLLGKKDEE
jgi:DNA-binding MarR family transcriptional regulator